MYGSVGPTLSGLRELSAKSDFKSIEIWQWKKRREMEWAQIPGLNPTVNRWLSCIQEKKESPNKSCNSRKGHNAKGAKLTEQVWERKESVSSHNLWI